MISEFKIKNFRLFEDIEIRRLSRVNLIAGKNSAGKSALLEAFLLYFSGMSTDVLMELLNLRQEDWESVQNKYSSGFAASGARHLFKDHRMPELSEDGFKLSSGDNGIHIKTAAYVREESEKGLKRRPLDADELDHYDSDFLDKYLIMDDGAAARILFSLDNSVKDIRRRIFSMPKTTTMPCQFVSTHGISDKTASSLWDGISLTDIEKEVIKGIKLIEPDVTGIAFVEANRSARSEGRIPLVKIANINEPVPLKSLGDGMTRIFQIILSLVCAKDGVLMVDEFENGLHWSIQKDVWNIVFKLSKRLNVQVFCSTHSRDSVHRFQEVWNSHKKFGSFIRIDRHNGNSSVKEYDLELLSDSMETDVEVR